MIKLFFNDKIARIGQWYHGSAVNRYRYIVGSFFVGVPLNLLFAYTVYRTVTAFWSASSGFTAWGLGLLAVWGVLEVVKNLLQMFNNYVKVRTGVLLEKA